MRITYLHQYFNTPEMSGGTRSYEMARRLVAAGHEVNMITSWRKDDGKKGWYETEESGIHVHWLPVPYANQMGFQARIRAFFYFAWEATKKAATFPANVVFATSTPLTIALPGTFIAWRRKIPMVFEVRDLWPELPIAIGALQNPILKKAALLLEQFAYSRSERVVALSPGMKKGVVKAGFPAEKITVIPNSSDIDLFDPKCADRMAFRKEHPEIGENPLVVYAGTMGKINGVDYLPRIAAASWDQGQQIQFCVIGDGIEEKKIRKIATELNVLNKNFHMYPAMPKQKMPEVLVGADMALSFVVNLKPLWTNSANKYFDALASGTPIAINHGGWQAELIKKSGAGIVLPPNNPEEAARCLGDFLSDKTLLDNAGAAALKLAQRCFSRDKLAKELEHVLLKATGH